MSSVPQERFAGRPFLKAYHPDEDDGPLETDDGLEISDANTVREFFDRWFRPHVLDEASQGTVTLYMDSLKYWELHTDNPQLAFITSATMIEWKRRMREEATYRRGKTSPEVRLKPYTIAKHLKNIRTILHRTGPERDPNRPTAGLLDKAPHLRISVPTASRPKSPFEIETARRIIQATASMPGTRRLPASATRRFWYALIVVLYYTGLRLGTVLKLEFSMVERRRDGNWLAVPARIVEKTSKPVDKFLHPEALAAIQLMRGIAKPGAKLIFAWPHWKRHLNNRHDYLQRLARIAKEDRLSPHAWRRTHGTEMGRLGAKRGLKVAQQALDHADDRTTSSFYVELEPELIAMLPTLGPPPFDPQLRLF